ncbi:hypothetical protein FRB96_004368 [Tulasnella sp. 330]|nr:hypothetical protein FRB96_004368 [Tulasnella sp. 330]
MYSTFTYICDVLRNPFRSTSAKVAASTPEDQPAALPPASSPISDQAHHPIPSSSSSKSVLSSRTIAAHHDFMHQAAHLPTIPKPSRCQSRRSVAKAKALVASSTLSTPLNPSDISSVTTSVESREDGRDRGKRARFDVPDAPVIVDQYHDQLHAPHVYLDHVAHAEASAAYLRSLRPSAPLFAPLVIAPPIYYNVTTPSVQSSSPVLANYLGAGRSAGNTQEQELKRKRMRSLVQTLTETPAERHALTRLSLQPRHAPTPAPPQLASTPNFSPPSSDEILSFALIEDLYSNPSPSPPPTENRTNIKDRNQYTSVAPAKEELRALEQPAKAPPGTTEYPEPQRAANGNQEMIRIVGQDGSLHALVCTDSPILQVFESLVSTYGLHVEESLTQEVPATVTTAATRHADSPNGSRIDVLSSSSGSGRSTVKSSELQSSVATSLSSTSDVSSRELADSPSSPDAHLSAESDCAPYGSDVAIAGVGVFSITTRGADEAVVGADNRSTMARDFEQGHAPGNLVSAPLAVTVSGSTDLASSEGSMLLGVEGPSYESVGVIHDGQSLVTANAQLGLEEVDFAALAMLPASNLPCASSPLRFAGLFKKRAKFVDASFTLRAHCRRENTWWLLVEGPTGSNLGNFTFGLSTEMSYANDGLVDVTVLPLSSRNVLKRRYFVTDQETASQIAQLLQRPTGTSAPFYSPATSVITPDDPNAATTIQPYTEISAVSANGPPILLIHPVAESLTPAQSETVAPQELKDPHQTDDGTQVSVEDSDVSGVIETTSVLSAHVVPTSHSEIVMHAEASLAIDESTEVIPDEHQNLNEATATADLDVVFVNGEVATEANITTPQPEPASFEVDAFLDTVMDDYEAVPSTNGVIAPGESTSAPAIVEDDMGLSDYEEDEEMVEGDVSDLAVDTDGMDESEFSAPDPLLVLVSQLASPPAVTFGPAAHTSFSDVIMSDVPTSNAPQALPSPILPHGSTIATYAEAPAQINQASTVPPLAQPASTPRYGTAPGPAVTSTLMPRISTFATVEQSYRVAEPPSPTPPVTAPPTTIGLPLLSSPAPSVAVTTASSILNLESTAMGLAANIAGDPVKSYARAGSSSSSNSTTVVPASSTAIARIASTSSTSTAATLSNAIAAPSTPGQGFGSPAFTIMSTADRSAEDDDEDEAVEQLRAPRHWEGEDDNPTMATWRIGAPQMAQPTDAAESFISDVVTTIGINSMTSTLASRTIGRRRTAAEMNDDPTNDF